MGSSRRAVEALLLLLLSLCPFRIPFDTSSLDAISAPLYATMAISSATCRDYCDSSRCFGDTSCEVDLSFCAKYVDFSNLLSLNYLNLSLRVYIDLKGVILRISSR